MHLELAQPAFLILLLVPVGVYFWRRGRRATLLFPGLASLGPGISSRVPGWVGEALRFLSLSAIVLALAGPRSPDLRTRMPTEGIAIMIVLDHSHSMQEETVEWAPGSGRITRAEAARRAFHLFVAGGEGPDGTIFEGRSTERGTDAIGLVVFSNWPHPVCPPTLNHRVLLSILDGLHPPTARDTGTNVGDAIAEGVLALDRIRDRRRVLILLSDGEHNVDLRDEARQPLKPRQAAALAANLDIPIYSIDAGGEPRADQPQEARNRLAGREINRQVAEMTRGRSFIANDGPELLQVCREIDRLERQPIVAPVYRRYHNYDAWLYLTALALAGLVIVLECTIWRRLP